MQHLNIITRIHAAIRFPSLNKHFDADLDLLLSESKTSLKRIFSKGLLTISSLIEHSTTHTSDPVKSVRLWLRLDGPPVRVSVRTWKSLHERGKSGFSQTITFAHVGESPENLSDLPAPHETSVLLARSLASTTPPPAPLLDQILEDLTEGKAVAYNATLLACALPRPAFLHWGVDENATSLAPVARDISLSQEKATSLLTSLFRSPEAGLCLPGLIELADRESLDSLDIASAYKIHGNVMGSLIMVALAGRGVSAVDPLPEEASMSRAVAVLQRKLRVLWRPSQPTKPLKSAGWLSIFGDFFGSSSLGSGAGGGLRILALDGGGTRALVTTTILRRLCGKTPVHEMFDVIVGTSAGGLLAIALGCMKMSIDDAERVIREVGEEVFAVGNNASTLQSASRFYFYGERHSSRDLRRKLHAIYGDMSLLDLSVYHDSHCKVAAVSTLSSEIPAKPFLFRNYSLESRYLGSWKFPATTAAMATTAAPTFFRPVVVGKSGASEHACQFQDGAMLANNPAHVALHEAVKMFPAREVAALVSIGTGRSPWERGNFSANKASLIHSLTRDLNILIYSATSTEAVADILADMLDKQKFFRFQPDLERIVELDEARPEVLAEIVASTERYLEAEAAKLDAVNKLLTGTSVGSKFKPFSKL